MLEPQKQKEVRFYHLLHREIVQTVPDLVGKGLENGHRIVVRARDAAMVAYLDDYLWTFRPDRFLPHGAGDDKHSARQPVWITDGDDRPNDATMLVAAGRLPVGDIGDYQLCCILFDGQDDAQVKDARAQWKAWQGDGLALTYWQQTEKGGWEKKV